MFHNLNLIRCWLLFFLFVFSSSINSQAGVKTESWNASKSVASVPSTTGAQPNGPLRPYMSAAATPTSSHHAPYTPCSPTSSASIPGPYEASGSKKEPGHDKVNNYSAGGAYLAPTNTEPPPSEVGLLDASGSASGSHTPIPSVEELQVCSVFIILHYSCLRDCYMIGECATSKLIFSRMFEVFKLCVIW